MNSKHYDVTFSRLISHGDHITSHSKTYPCNCNRYSYCNAGVCVHGNSDISAERKARCRCCLCCHGPHREDTHIQQKVMDGRTDNTLIHSPFLIFSFLYSALLLFLLLSHSIFPSSIIHHHLHIIIAIILLTITELSVNSSRFSTLMFIQFKVIVGSSINLLRACYI